MATPDRPSSIQPNTSSLKSAARKLPIKRKSPTQLQPPINSTPTPNPNPNLVHPHPTPVIPDDDCEDDESDDESHDQEANVTPSSSANGSPGDHAKPPPFKFHRIWSESDEIRFLQGLLGCWSQGLIFPRDLNLFYDRFSESLPQPYSRYQLSEKLRRLRKKFRVMSGRISAGQDPVRLPPHDRDLLHLCTRLWDPLHASSSPFSHSASSGGAPGNKRRRRNPRAPPPAAADAPANERNGEEMALVAVPAAALPAAISVVDDGMNEEDMGYVTAKAVMDAFDGSLKEMRAGLLLEGSSGGEMSRRWQEQQAAELDVFARRLRLVLEQSLRNRFS